jgi:hypothetical protein
VSDVMFKVTAVATLSSVDFRTVHLTVTGQMGDYGDKCNSGFKPKSEATFTLDTDLEPLDAPPAPGDLAPYVYTKSSKADLLGDYETYTTEFTPYNIPQTFPP